MFLLLCVSFFLEGQTHPAGTLQFFRDTPFESIFAALSIIALLYSVRKRISDRIFRWLDKRYLRTRLGAELFTAEDILGAIHYYVEPDCQDIDPSGSEEWRRTAPVRQNAFAALDRLLASPEYRHTILLADSGMGKTSLLLSYYARARRSLTHKMNLAIVPLGYPRNEDAIKAIPNQRNTILLLDAFDEDTKATTDHQARLTELLELTSEFHHVLITCRTQFFRKDDEIPKETGIVRFGPTKAGQEHQYIFYKLYLSPFNDEQIQKYLKKRWPFWQRALRIAAKKICDQMGDLTVRPLVLTHLDAFIGKDKSYKYSFQIYEQIIDSWLKRESSRVNIWHLRTFSESLAIEIYTRREELGGERLPSSEAEGIAKNAALSLGELEIRVRSLLNRDAEGRLKFAHRSIMEYLYVRGFMEHPKPQPRWTDQMKKIFLEIAVHGDAREMQKARMATVHSDVNLREEITREILRLHPGTLVQSPVAISLARFLRGGVEFLVVLEKPNGQLRAVSKRRLPNDFVQTIPDRFQIFFDFGSLGVKHYEATCQISTSKSMRPYYDAAFGAELAGNHWESPGIGSPHYREWEAAERCLELVLVPAIA